MKISFLHIPLVVIITAGCKEKCIPSVTSPRSGYLVVEGFISSSPEPTSIRLSRTVKLVDSVSILYEHDAAVTIESVNNATFPLFETGDGVYVSASLNLNSSEKYRLRIRTTDNKEYLSDFVPSKHTPPIDSVSWQRENNGLKIYMNTHDPQNNTRYYRWKYEETWEIHSAYKTALKCVNDPGGNLIMQWRDPYLHLDDTTIYKCWPSYNSTTINLGTSEKLSIDRIYLPIVSIEPKSEKLSVLYSIDVRLYALSHEAYLVLGKIKKNTEQVGSIFDAQPSELKGNIHCTGNPAEIVVGFVDVSDEKEQRIFISNSDVPGWNYEAACPRVIIEGCEPGFIPLGPHEYSGLAIKDYFAAESVCVDCTLRGTNVRPAFWP